VSGTNVLVAAPVRGGKPDRAVSELLGGAREAAQRRGGAVWAAALGDGAPAAAADLVAHGADVVLTWEDGALQRQPADAGVAALQAAAAEAGASLLLLPADSRGRDWAPRLAYRLKGGLVSECIGWRWGDGAEPTLLRPVYGGKAVQEEVPEAPVTLAVMRPGALAALEPDPSRHGDVRPLAVSFDGAGRPELVEQVVEASEGPKLEEARVIVSGGRGLGGPENFRMLQDLADVLGAAVGASRAAVDEGWVPASWQIGQTGKSVRPDLYLAFGISGASQHMAGLAAAKTIVAVNSDEQAPIFETARLGVVGDYRQILPPLIDACRRLLGK
jgi:electron transfer flavoprotein alpha subunit